MAQPIIEICHVTKIYTLFKNNKEQFLSYISEHAPVPSALPV